MIEPGEAAAVLESSPDGAGRRASKQAPRMLLAGAALAALLVLAPLAFTFWRASANGLDDAVELLFRALVGELLLNTLWITLGATAASAVIGTATAWFIERTHLPGRRLWAMLAAAPLAMPAFVSSYAWVSISLDLQDFAGALLVITSAYFPLVYLPVAAALRGMDPARRKRALARLRTMGRLRPRGAAAIAARAARRHAARRARCAVRVRRVSDAALSHVHDRDLRGIPHELR